MKIACSTSAFKMPINEALDRVHELGFEYVDLICIPGFGHIMPKELVDDFDGQIQSIEAMLKKSQLTPVAINTSLGHLHQRPDAETIEQRKKEAAAVCKLMNHFGIKVGSFYPGYRAEDRDWEEVLKDTAQSIHEILEVAEAHGVTLGVELHFATPFETIEQGTRLLDVVPELKVVFDPSHYAMQKIPMPETAPFLDRLAHVHLRDAAPDKMTECVGKGTVDFEWIIGALKDRNYEGDLSLEYLPKMEGGNPEEELVKLKKKLEEIGV